MTNPNPNLALVPFVSVENMMRLILEIGTENCMVQIAEYIEEDFRRWERFDKTPRVASHSTDGVIELMPTSDGIDYGFKYVNGHPKNMKDGLQTVTAFGLLASVDTGYPVLLTEMTILTALRTAATSAVATKYLAQKGGKTLAMIGNGAQSEFQALALKAICGIENLRLFDIDPAATEKCIRNLRDSGLNINATALPHFDELIVHLTRHIRIGGRIEARSPAFAHVAEQRELTDDQHLSTDVQQ